MTLPWRPEPESDPRKPELIDPEFRWPQGPEAPEWNPLTRVRRQHPVCRIYRVLYWRVVFLSASEYLLPRTLTGKHKTIIKDLTKRQKWYIELTFCLAEMIRIAFHFILWFLQALFEVKVIKFSRGIIILLPSSNSSWYNLYVILSSPLPKNGLCRSFHNPTWLDLNPGLAKLALVCLGRTRRLK